MTHTPRKRFGQHFLHDKGVIDRIISAIAPKPNQHLVEIGPGQGAITLPILKVVKQLEVVEVDRDLIPDLRARCERSGDLIVHLADVLDFDFNLLKTDDRQLRVFGNLPYNISTPLIFHLLTFAPIISDMIFMVQKEVAERLAGKAGSDHYGRLSVMVQYHCQVDRLFDVSPNAFYPPPQVQSSIVRLVPYKTFPYPANDYTKFENVVRLAFNQRRKTLRNSLKTIIDNGAWASLSVKSDLRPEELSVQDFVAISNTI